MIQKYLTPLTMALEEFTGFIYVLSRVFLVPFMVEFINISDFYELLYSENQKFNFILLYVKQFFCVHSLHHLTKLQ